MRGAILRTALLHAMEIIEKMKIVRYICSLGHTDRQKHKVPVSQPLQSITITGIDLSHDLKDIISEELNVKEVICLK